MRTGRNSIDEAVDDLDTILKWRKLNIHNEYTDQSFPLEIYRTGFINIEGADSQDTQIIWFKYGNWRLTIPKLFALMKEYMIYSLENILKGRKSDLKTALIFDGQAMRLTSVDMNLYYFFATTLTKYYPFVEFHAFMVNFPKSIDTTIHWGRQHIVNKQISDSSMVMKQDELVKYIDINMIPKALNGLNDKKFPYVPPGIKPIEFFSRVNFNSDDVKQVYQNFAGVF